MMKSSKFACMIQQPKQPSVTYKGIYWMQDIFQNYIIKFRILTFFAIYLKKLFTVYSLVNWDSRNTRFSTFHVMHIYYKEISYANHINDFCRSRFQRLTTYVYVRLDQRVSPCNVLIYNLVVSLRPTVSTSRPSIFLLSLRVSAV